MSALDIILVKPGSQRQVYGELSSFDLTAIEPPLWPALLAGFLRAKGYSVAVLDAEAENLSPEQTAKAVSDAGPLLAAVVVSGTNPSASTMNMPGAGAIVSRLRELAPQLKSLLMGLHPSALPGRTMTEEDCDFVCQGEGFITLPALLDALRGKARALAPIDGLWRRQGKAVVSGPRPATLPDLDRLPMPAWDLFPMKAYRAHNWHCFGDIEHRQPYGLLYTSLGCPYRCNFCCINSLFGKPGIRLRGVDNVLHEIDYLVERHGIRHIKIIDEMFAVNERRVTTLCDAIAARGYDLNMWAYARVNTVTDRMLESMKRCGINWVAYGFESGSERVLKNASKGYDPGSVDAVVAKTYAHGLNICANFIFGLPTEDYDSMEQTLESMLRINAQWANIYCAMAYPGSKLYEEALEKNLPLPETWLGYSQYAYETLPLPTGHLSGGQVLAFRDYAFHAYHANPRYLDMIRRAFGMDAVRHIMRMTEKRLPRLHAEPVEGYALSGSRDGSSPGPQAMPTD
ncbi:MAG: B12-binding domain-containing radical SAM protein [Desulfovibrionaceae bacterium]|nr:B12-binding domain-containing radical SAM protein [Desulfovibrionaceae bacterium]